jgi:hypothetical protein
VTSFVPGKRWNFVPVGLRLSYNELTGTISADTFNSSFLEEFAVDNNRFSGLLPSVEGRNLSLLQVVTLNNNQFTGTIPSSYFQNLPKLTTFALSTNCLSGTLPSEICNATSLLSLIMDGLTTASTVVVNVYFFLPFLRLIHFV